MDTDLTLRWTNAVLRQFSFTHQWLACNTYDCYLMPVVQASLKVTTIDTVLISGGCTKYIQAQPPNVSWNKPFKAICIEKYNEWLETVGIHQETDAENLKPLPHSTIVN